MKYIAVLITGLALSLAWLTTAHAETGVLNALSLRPIPVQKVIEVQALDDSDENLLLQVEIEKQLVANGFTLTKKGDVILNFETRDQIGGWNSGSDGHIISLEASGGRGDGEGENRSALVNVYGSSSGGLLNRKEGIRPPSSIASKYRLDVSIERRDDGKTLWRAWSVADLESGEGLTLTKKMIPLLVESIGKTVRSQAFTVE